MSWAINPPVQASVPIAGQAALFPVRRVYCVGRNYHDHVAEMGGTPGREPPFFFQKPADAVNTSGAFPYPPSSSNVHHELELVVALGEGASIFGYAIGLDMTRRDLQAELKKGGKPWEAAKAFDHSAPVSAIVPVAVTGELKDCEISLHVNGALRQHGNIRDMIWSTAEIIAELCKLFELKAGDIIFTGTPSGVGPVKPGDVMEARLGTLAELQVRVTG